MKNPGERDAAGELDERWVHALRQFHIPTVDVDSEWKTLQARLDIETSAGARTHNEARRRAPRTRVLAAFAAVSAVALGSLGVSHLAQADPPNAALSDDGSTIGQLFIEPKDPSAALTVDVSSNGRETCLEVNQGAGGGAICSTSWRWDAGGPRVLVRPVDGRENQLTMIVVAPIDRPVGVSRRGERGRRAESIDDLPGVSRRTARIQDREVFVWVASISGSMDSGLPFDVAHM